MSNLPAFPVGESEGTVPKRAHRIWIGSAPPKWVLNNWRLWDEALPGWTINSWTDDNLPPGGSAIIRTIREFEQPWRGVADFLRLWVTGLYGGMYIDSDFVPLFPASYFENRGPWVAAMQRNIVWNGFFGMPPGHRYPAAIWEHGINALKRGVRWEHNITGPQAWEKVRARGEWPDLYVDRTFRFVTQKRFRTAVREGRVNVRMLNEIRALYPEVPAGHIGTWGDPA